MISLLWFFLNNMENFILLRTNIMGIFSPYWVSCFLHYICIEYEQSNVYLVHFCFANNQRLLKPIATDDVWCLPFASCFVSTSAMIFLLDNTSNISFCFLPSLQWSNIARRYVWCKNGNQNIDPCRSFLIHYVLTSIWCISHWPFLLQRCIQWWWILP